MTWTTPADIGLPYAAFRPDQEDAIRRIEATDKKVVLLMAPTGAGKSGIAAGAARALGMRAIYMSSTKDLQRQFIETFEEARIIMGRSNYPAAGHQRQFPLISCADCDKSGRGEDAHCSLCPNVALCPYTLAKAEAEDADFAVLNTDYWLTEANGVGKFSDAKMGRGRLVVIDEGDTLPRILMGMVEVEVPQKWMTLLRLSEPKWKTPNAEHVISDWLPWMRDAIQAASLYLARLQADIAKLKHDGATGNHYRTLVRDRGALSALKDKIDNMVKDLEDQPDGWVRTDVEGERGGPKWKPIRVSRFGQEKVWSHGERFLVMSATIHPEQFCEDTGLDQADVEFIEMPSSFPLPNRRIYVHPRASMSHANKETAWPRVVAGLDEVLFSYPERTLVHTHSYELARYVMEHSAFAYRMVTYRNAAEREGVLEAYKAVEGSILVAPSMERGISLDDDLARCVVVLKVPYPYLGDRQVNARVHSRGGDTWYRSETIAALAQACGRGVRTPTDWCDTYILDSEFRRLPRHLMYRWFAEALVTDPALVQRALMRIEHPIEAGVTA